MTAALLGMMDLPSKAQDATNVLSEPTSPNSVQALGEILKLVVQGDNEGALAKANELLLRDPTYIDAHIVRGNVYMNQRDWIMAGSDYQIVLRMDPDNTVARLSLAEIDFRQKNYESARSGFSSLTGDLSFGDYSRYKAFMCDMLSSHEEAARAELDGFDEAHSKPSYYFGNGAWALFHHNPDAARGYFISASKIYPLKKIKLYTSDLTALGYLPLPPVFP